MSPDYSRSALTSFLDFVQQKGLANKNSAIALRVATEKILSDLSQDEENDVRKIDITTAVRRFHNKNPNQLSPSSLAVYQRRVLQAIREFTKYRDDPTRYSGFGRSAAAARVEQGDKPRKRSDAREKQTRDNGDNPAQPVLTPTTPMSAGLSIPFPLRHDFLAQVVIPRDLRANEAKRLSDFIATLVVSANQPS